MLEVLIIICLAVALFLLLRHYPEVSSPVLIKKSRLKEFFSRFKLKDHLIASRMPELVRDEEKASFIPAPDIVNEAKEKYANLDPEVAGTLTEAEKALAENDLRLAEEKAIEVISKNKRCAAAYLIVGKVAYDRGQFNDSKEALKAGLKCDRETAEPYFWIGKIALKNENYSEAIVHLQKCIALEKGHAEWYAELGKAYNEVRQFAKAAKVLRRAASLDIDNTEYRNLASEAEEKQRTHSVFSRRK